MKKWVISSLVYLAVVFGAYGLWSISSANHQQSKVESSMALNNGSEMGHDMEMNAESEVTPIVSYTNGVFTIALKDKSGEPFDELVLSHEKLMHFIVVSDDLTQYYHLHPERKKAGEYQVPISLQNGGYKVFVDIKPYNKNYHVEPIAVKVGTPLDEKGHLLTPDTNLSKTVNGHTVTLTPSSPIFKAGDEITLNFLFKNNEMPEPYLGALGHVVILDEKAQTYLHVHPSSAKETKFETNFTKAGNYKIWAEFQFDGKVHVYPFVIHVQ